MTFAKSSQQPRRRSAILSLAIVALAVTWTAPSYGFDFWNWGKSKKCPSGTAWSKQQGKCVALKNRDRCQTRTWRERVGSWPWTAITMDAIKVLEMASNENDPAVLTYLGYSHRKLGEHRPRHIAL